MDELFWILVHANRAKREGYPMPEIEAKIASETGGRVTSYRALLEAVRAAPEYEPTATPGNVARSMGQGAAFNMLDELAGGATSAALAAGGAPDALPRGRAVRDQMRLEEGRFDRQEPGLALTSELAGAALPAVLTGGMAAPRMATMGLKSRMALSGGIGAGVGALAGAGDAPTMGEVLPGAARGAAAGGVGAALLGPVTAAGGQLIGRGWNKGVELAAPRATQEGLMRRAVRGMLGTPSSQAYRQLQPGARALVDALKNEQRAVSAKIYGPLEGRANIPLSTEMRKVLRSRLGRRLWRDVGGDRAMKTATFRQLQRVRLRLEAESRSKGAAAVQARELLEEFQKGVAGTIPEWVAADAAYAQAMESIRQRIFAPRFETPGVTGPAYIGLPAVLGSQAGQSGMQGLMGSLRQPADATAVRP